MQEKKNDQPVLTWKEIKDNLLCPRSYGPLTGECEINKGVNYERRRVSHSAVAYTVICESCGGTESLMPGPDVEPE